MAEDYFEATLALNTTTGTVVPNAVAEVYAISDTSFTSPLAITDLTGASLPSLVASPTGVYPAFKCAGVTQVIARSGGINTPLTSILGRLFEIVPDPSTGDEGDVVKVASGEFVLGAGSGDGSGGSGILTFPVGADTSSVPEGGVFGTYVPPVVNTVPQRVGTLVQTSGGSVTATSIVLDPAMPTEGTAVQIDDWMIVVVGANAPSTGEDWTAPAGWTELRADYSLIGTQRVRVYAKKRVAGETTYSFGFSGSRHLNAAMVWVRGADTLGTWVLGAAKDRSAAPTESVTCTAPAITTSRPATLVLALSIERTTASEVGVTWSGGATEWLFAGQVGSAVITIAIGYSELATAGTEPAKTITYPNAQSVNGWAFQIGIPGV